MPKIVADSIPSMCIMQDHPKVAKNCFCPHQKHQQRNRLLLLPLQNCSPPELRPQTNPPDGFSRSVSVRPEIDRTPIGLRTTSPELGGPFRRRTLFGDDVHYSMSAYAALYGPSGGAEDEDVPSYLQASSDDENSRSRSVPVPAHTVSVLDGLVEHSNFKKTGSNFSESAGSVCLRLVKGEYVLVYGLFRLLVEQGTISVNNVHCLSSTSGPHTVIAPSAQALPVLAAVSTTCEICLHSVWTGLDRLGLYHLPFRGYMHQDNSMNRLFDIVLEAQNDLSGMNVTSKWQQEIAYVSSQLGKLCGVAFVAGNKNSGKSTLSKLLLNLLIDQNGVAAYLDIDPGQTEFSLPLSLSITIQKTPIYGARVPSEAEKDDLSHFYGFTLPQNQPTQYVAIIRSLFDHYETVLRPQGIPLVVNTPGWIKGFGRELLAEISAFIRPQMVLFLTGAFDTDVDSTEILQDLTYGAVRILPAVHKTSRFSASQLRVIQKLLYFHQTRDLEFDFSSHLLRRSPLRLSYETYASGTVLGVNAVTVLNHNADADFALEDLFLMLNASVAGIYLIEESYYSENISGQLHHTDDPNVPFYLDLSAYTRAVDYKQNVIYGGLCAIHSINTQKRYLNLYFPFHGKTAASIRSHVQKGYKVLLVRGDAEIPSCEVLMPELVLPETASYEDVPEEPLPQLPYVSFGGRSRVGGVWRTRRNVQRKSLQR